MGSGGIKPGRLSLYVAGVWPDCCASWCLSVRSGKAGSGHTGRVLKRSSNETRERICMGEQVESSRVESRQ